MQVIWLEIVLIDNAEPIGAMGLHPEQRLEVVPLLDALVVVMQLTVNTR